MKKVLIGLGLIVIAASCSQNPPQQQANNVTIQSSGPAGFDVNKLAQLVKTSTDPQTLEKAINDPNNHINNLDLDKDNNIDYLKVMENGQNQLTVIDNVSNTDSVTVARINIEPNQNNNTANLTVQGNPTYAGYDNYYHSSFSFTDFLLLSYLMRPHMYYMPMYHYGYYPSYYSRVRTVRNFRTTTSSSMSSRSSSSFHNSSRSNSRSSLSSPTRSQRSFSTRNNSAVRSGGFGRSNNNSSARSSGFGRSNSSFGRSNNNSSTRSSSSVGRSGFGRSGSSFGRSSGGSSRSSGFGGSRGGGGRRR